MMTTIIRLMRGAGFVLAALGLSACVNTPKPLYAWNGYQKQVYEHLNGKGNGPEQQILDIQKDLGETQARNEMPPPGLYAHLGLLYLSTGKPDLSYQAWQKEKSLFPESTKYMDFLMNNVKKAGN